MNLVRKYKLSKLINVPFTKKEQKIISLLNTWLRDLTIFKTNEHPDKIFYMNKKGKFVISYNDKQNKIYFQYNDFFEKFEKLNNFIDLLKYFLKIKLKIDNDYIEIYSHSYEYSWIVKSVEIIYIKENYGIFNK